jgi:hypothetical protein
VLKALRETGKPIYWVGQLLSSGRRCRLLSVTNGIVKQRSRRTGRLSSTSAGLTDDEGNFTYSGPTDAGKKLRPATHAFQLPGSKLAFFVEQSIRDQPKGVALPLSWRAGSAGRAGAAAGGHLAALPPRRRRRGRRSARWSA